MKFKFRNLWIFLFSIFLLQSCGGADLPYILTPPSSGDNPGTGLLPDEGAGGIGTEGCTVTLNSIFVLRTKLNAGDAEDLDENNILVTDPRELPPIILHFSGNVVSMYGDEFQPAEFTLGTSQVQLTQKAGTKASGTYDEAGNVTLNGVIFEMLQPIPTLFPSFTLSTGNTGEISGSGGSISETGSPLNAEKKISLVGGFVIDRLVEPFNGKALTVNISGTLDKIPSPATCSGSGGGGGVSFKEITKDGEGKEIETPLGSNVLSMGSIFIPEKGVDPENSSASAFKKTKILRIQNNTASAIAGTFTSSDAFHYNPTSVNVAPDQKQDVTVTFSSAGKIYTPQDPAITQELKSDLSLGGSTLSVAGLMKRAGPEITMEGGENGASSNIDFKIAPVRINGSGESSQIACSPQYSPTILANTVTLKNTGVRTLNITSIPPPVLDDANDTKVDPFCPSFGAKFQRMALSVSPTGATCITKVVNGHTYLTDQCNIPPGEGFVQFKAVYLPKNAKSYATNTKDSAKLLIPTNDPVYQEQAFTISMQAAVSKDTSDLLSLSRVKADGLIETFKLSNGERASLNAESAANNTVTQVYALQNESTDTLQNVQIHLSENLDQEHFKLCPVKADLSVDVATCALQNQNVIAQIPPMVGTEAGKSFFAIQFKGGSQDLEGPFNQELKIAYVPSSTPGASNEFKLGLGGTVGYKPLTGNVEMQVDFLSSYILYDPLPTPTDSVDFRIFDNVKAGSIRFILSPQDGNASNPMQNVQIYNEIEEQDVDFNVLNLEQRKQFVRLPSNRLMTCPSTPDKPGNKCTDQELMTCTDPAGALPGDYPDNSNFCSFFYYYLKSGAITGAFNNETGEFILPSININLYNPFHSALGAAYPENYKTDTSLKTTFTTGTLNAFFDASANHYDLVPVGSDRVSSLGVPSNYANNFEACPEGWNPTIDYDAQNPSASPTPKFTCYLAPRASAASPAFIRGSVAVPAPNGQRSLTLVALTRFNKDANNNEFIPFFMKDNIMWVAFQGRLKQCDENWVCPQ